MNTMGAAEVKLTGAQKAAVLVISLGAEASAQVLKNLDANEIEQIATEIAKIDGVSTEVRNKVLQEFYHMAGIDERIVQGGMNLVGEILSKALGAEAAMKIIERTKHSLERSAFRLMGRGTLPSEMLVELVQNEHPQVVALILAHLKQEQAAEVLSALPGKLQAEVILRMANMNAVSPEIIGEIERTLRNRLSSERHGAFKIGGVKVVAELLNKATRETERNVFEVIENSNPELVSQIREHMFVYEDLGKISDLGIQRIIKEVDNRDLILSLKASSNEVKERFFKNVSERKSQMIKEDMASLGPVRLREVEEAQRRIVSIARNLVQSGEVELIRSEKEEVFV